MRYRKPSLKTLLGMTAAKRRVKTNLGIYEVTKVLNTPKNAKRNLKRSLGYESGPMKFFRFLSRLLK